MTKEDNKKKPFTLFNNETGQSIELPVLTGTDGPDVLDIRNLYYLEIYAVPDDPVTSFEEPREGLGVQPAEVVRLRVYRLVVGLEEHCKKSNSCVFSLARVRFRFSPCRAFDAHQ